MKYRLLDILACPYCRHSPLKLIVFTRRKYPERKIEFGKIPVCEYYCQYREKFVKDLEEGEADCNECIKFEVEYGVLICEKCMRWYPIMEEIPVLLPDELRDRDKDIEFLRKFKEKIPEEILKNGKPFNLSEEK
ncbi:MAG: Trm112 family protein [Thermoprotei archaeon]|nr:MAG: Trm112 family protein [Thermoprotei archaeon]HDD64386.1 Trm112 family protein [Thermoprotei archaeon]